MKDFIDSLNWRYAVKKYDSIRKVPASDIDVLKEAVRLSVSSLGLQPYKVIVVETQAVKEELANGASGNNKNIFNDASHLFIFAIEHDVNDKHAERYIHNIAAQRDLAKEEVSGFENYVKNYLAGLTTNEKDIWSAKQAYIALSNLINTAALLKIDATPMEGFDADKINSLLSLEEKGLNTAVIAAVGYRHAEDEPQYLKKVRKPNEQLFITL